jgi:choline monooxygenase
MSARFGTFDSTIPIERASTPPAPWYVDPGFHDLEKRSVFRKTWQVVGRLDQLARAGDYISGECAGEPWVVVRSGDGELRAFFNVCRHHATCVASGDGNADRLVCPYHGWTYDLEGKLRKAPRMAGVQDFDRDRLGLVPMDVAAWGPFVFLRVERGGASLDDLMRPVDGKLNAGSLRFARRVEYELACNWKVYVDNYLDGGYHVEHLHRGLASQLDLDSYRTEIDGRVSLQLCGSPDGGSEGVAGDFSERIGEGAVYAFVYPNFMINRYGPIMDTNLVLPLGHDRTRVVFDYYFEPECSDEFIARSLAASDKVQEEDVDVCESVQRGLGSSAYDRGRYAPRVEQAAYHFHGLLAADVDAGAAAP